MTLITGSLAIALYLCIPLYQWLQLRNRQPIKTAAFTGVAAAAVALHGITSTNLVFTPSGVDFSLFQISSGIFFVVNLIVLVSSLRKPVQALFLILFPISAIELLVALFSSSTMSPVSNLPLSISLHIVTSILAYSVLTIASIQALFLAMQNWRLKHKHLAGWGQAIPPLEVMEILLFELLWAGFLLLTVSITSGLLFFENIFDQQLSHKMFFSMAAWVFYGILLWGHQVRGWRGNTAIRWTIGGFAALVLAYWGSKLVIEFLL